MKKDYAKIVVVLDRSGSMSSVKDSTIKGFNKFLKSQKELDGVCDISLYQFSDGYEAIYENRNIKEAPKLTPETYKPNGSTKLLDAIGKTIHRLGDLLRNTEEKDRPEKVIVVIQTDGEENASKEFTRNQIFDMITHQKEKYNWVFVFLGANQDAVATATSYGINYGSSLTYTSSDIGNNIAFNTLNVYTTGLRCAALHDTQTYSFSMRDRADNIIPN